MRILRHALTAFTLAPAVLGGLFGDSTSSSSGGGSVSSSSGGSSSVSSSSADNRIAPVNTPEVAFLLTLQQAQISSMSCLITLFNMTTAPIGNCLFLPSLASLVVGTDINGAQANGTNSLFSDQLALYLDETCQSSGCTQTDIADAQAQLANSCQGQDVALIKVLNAILANYQSSFHTLACMIQFNGTEGNCLPTAISTSPAANTANFFNDLVSGTNLEQYHDSVFNSAQCIGCIYEMYKAAVFVMSSVRGHPTTQTLGNHLQTCPNQGGVPNWPDVQDQQIPNSLQVSQNQNQGGGGGGSSFSSASASTVDLDWYRICLGAASALVVRIALMAMWDDPTDLSLCII